MRKQRRAHPDEAIWKQRFDRLKCRMLDLCEAADTEGPEKQMKHPMSSSEELFISFNWDIVDSESKAKELFGKRYERWVRG